MAALLLLLLLAAAAAGGVGGTTVLAERDALLALGDPCERIAASGGDQRTAQRRFNLIVYLNPDWRAEFGGALELWSSHSPGSGPTGVAEAPPAASAAECGARVLPLFNRAVLFSTTAPSLHGFPAPLACPADTPRRSLALSLFGRQHLPECCGLMGVDIQRELARSARSLPTASV